MHECILGVQKEERLQSELHCLGTTGPQQHTVFVDGAAEAAAWEPAAYFDTDASLLKRTFNRPRRGQVGHLEAAAGDPAHASKVSMCAAAHPSACMACMHERKVGSVSGVGSDGIVCDGWSFMRASVVA